MVINTCKIIDTGKEHSTDSVATYTLINSGSAMTFPLVDIEFAGDKTTNNQQAIQNFYSGDTNNTYYAYTKTSAVSLPIAAYNAKIVIDTLNASYTNHAKLLHQMLLSRSLLKLYNTPLIDQDYYAGTDSDGKFVYVRLKSLGMKAASDSLKRDGNGDKVSGYFIEASVTFERGE